MQYATSSQEINQFKKGSTLRNWTRHNALNGLSTYYKLSGKMNEAFKKNRIHFLLFHHLFEDEVENFRQFLQILSEQHTFISHSEAVDMILNGVEIDRPYISFSTDDGLISNLKAIKILDEFNIKACLFVCPSIVGAKNYSTITEFNKKRLNCPPMEFLTWKELEDLKKNGHEIGNHTMNHINFSEVSLETAEKDVIQAKEILEKRLGPTTHFAWPYGTIRHFSNTSKDLVFSTGHTSISSAIRGSHVYAPGIKAVEDLCIKRDNLLFSWPVKHLLYFVAKSALDGKPQEDGFPY